MKRHLPCAPSSPPTPAHHLATFKAAVLSSQVLQNIPTAINGDVSTSTAYSNGKQTSEQLQKHKLTGKLFTSSQRVCCSKPKGEHSGSAVTSSCWACCARHTPKGNKTTWPHAYVWLGDSVGSEPPVTGTEKTDEARKLRFMVVFVRELFLHIGPVTCLAGCSLLLDAQSSGYLDRLHPSPLLAGVMP